MNTARHLQPLLSAPARLAGAIAAIALLAGAVNFAGQASHKAVGVAHAAINPPITYVTLPTVEVLVRRGTGEPVRSLVRFVCMSATFPSADHRVTASHGSIRGRPFCRWRGNPP